LVVIKTFRSKSWLPMLSLSHSSNYFDRTTPPTSRKTWKRLTAKKYSTLNPLPGRLVSVKQCEDGSAAKTGQRSTLNFSRIDVGDTVRVRLASVDAAKGFIDFERK
jgi:translation initiation factor IF-1